MIAVAPGAIASIMRLRRARKVSPCPLALIAIHYATHESLALVASTYLQYLVTLARLVAGEGTASAPGVRVLVHGNPARGTST